MRPNGLSSSSCRLLLCNEHTHTTSGKGAAHAPASKRRNRLRICSSELDAVSSSAGGPSAVTLMAAQGWWVRGMGVGRSQCFEQLAACVAKHLAG